MKRLLTGALVVCMLMTCLFLLPDEAQAVAYYDNTQTETAYVAQNTTTGAMYADVTTALTQAQAGQTVVLLTDATADMVSVYEDICLDLAGKCLTVKYFSCFGDTVDTSANNAGLLVADHLMFTKDNDQLPVGTEEGYRFVEVERFDSATLNNGSKHAFQIVFEEAAHAWLAKGYETSGVRVLVNVSWNRNGNSGIQRFVYSDELVKGFVSSYANGEYGKMFTLTLQNSGDFQDLSFDVCVESFTGVSVAASDEDELPVSGNVVTKDTTITNEQGSAMVPAGTLLVEDAKKLVLTTTKMDETTSDVELGENEAMLSMDVHVVGVSEENTKPILVTLNEVALEGLNEGNIALYHVENGVTNKMTRVYYIEEVDEHNEFYYDIPTGTITMALMSFSEVAVVADEINAWNGVVNTDWYNDTQITFEIFNADQLAGLGRLVDEGNTFAGKTVRLMLNVKLSDGTHAEGTKSFDPIGFGYDVVFSGTFDGNGNTIFDLYQNGWDLGYSYGTQGGGLFASVVDATIKNLTMDNAYIVMECVDMGTVVGYAYGTCNFSNIIVSNSTVANYNRYTGGVVGEVNGTHVFDNVDVDAGTTLSALWGTFDPSIGGIIGGKWGNATVTMKNCDVACKLDVYNDVTSAYRWYSYRRCGMLIGNTEESVTDDNGRTEASASFLTTENCTVQYGNWANYNYCEFTNENYPFVRVEEGLFNGAYSNARYGNPIGADGVTKVTAENHSAASHKQGEACTLPIAFRQLYGGGQGCYGGNGHIGQGVTENNAPAVAAKFKSKDVKVVKSGTTITLGELFEASGVGADIQDFYVQAYVSPAAENITARGTVKRNTSDWTQTELSFTGEGMVKITVNDYYYCEPTIITVEVKEHYYTITYVHNSQELAVVSVDDNSKQISTENADAKAKAEAAMGNKYAFQYWMNAGSTRVDYIEAGHTDDVVLYPSFANLYTAMFVDQEGNILGWTTFTKNSYSSVTTMAADTTPPAVDYGDFKYWEVHVTDTEGNTTQSVPLSEYSFRSNNTDITLYPTYTYDKAGVALNPVDTDGDGRMDAFEVTGYQDGKGQYVVEIPDYVNGMPIIQVNSKAFSSYEDIHSIVIPKTVTDAGAYILAANWTSLFDSGESVTIYYAGSYADWQEAVAEFDDGWDHGLGNSSRIFFLNDGDTVDATQGWLVYGGYWNRKWTYNKTVDADIKSKYDTKCDCDDCDGADRPDRKFWADVVVG